MTNMQEVAVLGSGIMGGGIAQTMAVAGLRVLLFDVSEELLKKSLKDVETSLQRTVKKKTMTEADASAALGRITAVVGNDYSKLANSDLVVEVVPERIELKEKVLGAVAAAAKASAIIASNTSSISITKLASFVPEARQAQFAGLHFFNPVPVMKLIEVIRGLQTSDATVDALMQLSKKLGKTPVPCVDSPGFVCNRILVPMINEAAYAVFEGVATPADIDSVMKLGANHPMGPLSLADMIGLDTILSVMEVLHREFGEDKYRPCPLIRKMVDAKRLGRKTGHGFFNYKQSKL
eukprot:TRINITY_DN26581_c0_g1_i1.p1 TRINITY_DN26581_c0_g1~~TRINITY_DN26581_c0_g1_i1.p1  ORF type:complete len:293 (+),score=98.71 TRINITY_DN26581_c0_g1_i1:79-957(+)